MRPHDADKGATYSDQLGEAIKGLTPASSGWILAVVLIVTVIQVSALFQQSAQSSVLQDWLSDIEQSRADSTRRCQETIRQLAETVSRQADQVTRSIETATRTAEMVVRARDREIKESTKVKVQVRPEPVKTGAEAEAEAEVAE